MNHVDFEKQMSADGYVEIADRNREPTETSAEHSHEFDACLLVLEGEMTIACNGTPQTFRAGDTCSVPAGTPHTEQFGSGTAGVRFVAGRRYAPAS
jgi:mannose-6-phosphate isomerase-like protein (cupin superfamily)